MLHVENGTCEQPKRYARYVRNFISLACKFTALEKKSHSLLNDLRMHVSMYRLTH